MPIGHGSKRLRYFATTRTCWGKTRGLLATPAFLWVDRWAWLTRPPSETGEPEPAAQSTLRRQLKAIA